MSENTVTGAPPEHLPPGQTPPKAPDSSLRTRVKSALILAPVVLVVLYFGGAGFTLMMSVIAGIGVFEWIRMVTTGGAYPARIEWMAAVLAGFGVLVSGLIGSLGGGLCFLLALCFLLFAYNFSKEGPSLRRVYAGIVYIGLSVSVMIWLRNGIDNGLFHILTLLFIVWASDSFAYFTGRALGGPKLAPKISPKKTWSGFFGSSVGAGVVAALMASAPVTGWLGVATLGGLGMAGYFAIGFVLAMFGQAGDLSISVLKRKYNVKDTGNIIPGHGGILDRIDALLLVALVFGALALALGA